MLYWTEENSRARTAVGASEAPVCWLGRREGISRVEDVSVDDHSGLAVLLAPLLLQQPGAAEHVPHRVVPLVAGVLVEALVRLRPGQLTGVWRGVVGVLDRELVEQGGGVEPPEALDHPEIVVGDVRGVQEVRRLDDERVAVPPPVTTMYCRPSTM